ncbi:MAG TPA: adenylyl-sulfate kinase [Desulfobacterales bacterium]|nr:adenylyl-sulfate kinase [Desulfobacterales bacterium]
MVYWLTGLAGAGKTTIGRRLYHVLREEQHNTIFLDGDDLRGIMGNTCGHGINDRQKLAEAYARLCRLLSSQGFNVICATISMFHRVREWNRKHITYYTEIYIKVPMEILFQRNQKQIYSNCQQGKGQVVGVDLPFEEPVHPHIILQNDGSRPIDALVDELLFHCKREERETGFQD